MFRRLILGYYFFVFEWFQIYFRRIVDIFWCVWVAGYIQWNIIVLYFWNEKIKSRYAWIECKWCQPEIYLATICAASSIIILLGEWKYKGNGNSIPLLLVLILTVSSNTYFPIMFSNALVIKSKKNTNE